MSAITDNAIGFNFGYAIGEDGWKAGMDNNFALLAMLVQPNIYDKDLGTPPGSPATGDRYIIAGSPTGAWSGHAKKLAVWSAAAAAGVGAWVIILPLEGWRVFVVDEDIWYEYDGTNWIADEGSFTITLTGVSGSVTGTCYYKRSRGWVTLDVPELAGTSTSTSKGLTGIPAALRPTAPALLQMYAEDSVSTSNQANLTIMSDGTAVYSLFTAATGALAVTGWANTGAFKAGRSAISYKL